MPEEDKIFTYEMTVYDEKGGEIDKFETQQNPSYLNTFNFMLPILDTSGNFHILNWARVSRIFAEKK